MEFVGHGGCIVRRLRHAVTAPLCLDFPENSISRDESTKTASLARSETPLTCGKHATKPLKDVLWVNKSVENVATVGQKFLISPFDPTSTQKFWHSITRSSRSTCRMRRRTERGFGSGGERGLARGTELLQRAAEFGPRSVTINDVKCQPSYGGLSDTG